MHKECCDLDTFTYVAFNTLFHVKQWNVLGIMIITNVIPANCIGRTRWLWQTAVDIHVLYTLHTVHKDGKLVNARLLQSIQCCRASNLTSDVNMTTSSSLKSLIMTSGYPFRFASIASYKNKRTAFV